MYKLNFTHALFNLLVDVQDFIDSYVVYSSKTMQWIDNSLLHDFPYLTIIFKHVYLLHLS